ncbi:MAG: hypothetical protein R3E02_16330 [Blastomonas sp.]
MLKPITFLAALGGLMLAAPAMAQDDSPPDYDAAIRCASFYTVMSATDDNTPEEAADFETKGTNWLLYAYALAGGNMEAAEASYEAETGVLLGLIENIESNPDAFSNRIIEDAVTCAVLEETYSAEIDAMIEPYQ